jgi:hypothetical protein
MQRRRFVGLSLGLVGLPGCDARQSGERATGSTGAERTADASVSATATATPNSERPYRASDGQSLDRPRGITLTNVGTQSRFFTLVVSDGDSDVFVDSRSLDEDGRVSFDGLVATTGTYDVLLETADGQRRSHEWEVSETFDKLAVDVGSSVTFRQTAVCTPDCPPLSASDSGDTDANAPVDAADDRKSIVVDNDTDAQRTVTLRLTAGVATVVDETYEVPPDVRLVVVVPEERFRYRVELESEDTSRRYEWLSGRGDRLYVSLGGEVGISCTRRAKDLLVINETEADREVTVVGVTDGEQSVDETVSVGAMRETRVPEAVPAAGSYRFVVETGERRESYEWSVCPPPGPVTVTVKEEGIQVSVPPSLDE